MIAPHAAEYEALQVRLPAAKANPEERVCPRVPLKHLSDRPVDAGQKRSDADVTGPLLHPYLLV